MDVGSVLLPLDAFVKSGALDLSKVDASAVAAGTVGGKLYALPLAANMPGMLYNKSLLERAGAPLPKVSMTWDEFGAWLAAVKAKLPAGVAPIADNSSNTDQSYFFGYWMRQNGTRMWDGTKSYMTAADAQKYFDLWAGWRAAGFTPDAQTAGTYAETNESTSSLIAGKVAACVIWSNQLLGYQNATKDTLDLMELPNAVASKALWGQMSQMMAINKNSKNAEAAAKFISYRVNDPVVWKFMGADPGNPVNSEARADRRHDRHREEGRRLHRRCRKARVGQGPEHARRFPVEQPAVPHRAERGVRKDHHRRGRTAGGGPDRRADEEVGGRERRGRQNDEARPGTGRAFFLGENGLRGPAGGRDTELPGRPRPRSSRPSAGTS